jgi:hypothetical protein
MKSPGKNISLSSRAFAAVRGCEVMESWTLSGAPWPTKRRAIKSTTREMLVAWLGRGPARIASN